MKLFFIIIFIMVIVKVAHFHQFSLTFLLMIFSEIVKNMVFLLEVHFVVVVFLLMI